MRHKFHLSLIMLLGLLIITCPLWSGTTGKIAGTVTDQQTGDPLAGANVIIAGTSLGAAADMDGNYTILHVPPSSYDVQVTVIGYTKMTVSNVRTRIDQTTRVDFGMQMEAIEGEAVTIVAERTGIKEDVATSVVSVSAQEVAELPVSNIENIVGMQAGIRGEMEIRGGQSNNTLFMMDGVTLRDPRNNEPISSIALSAVQEISIERGGFSAEYGQVQSGLINVVTKEGSKTGYHGSVTTKYSPPAPKHRGMAITDPNSMWMRPYLDDDVCWTGTSNGAWDQYTRRQYLDFQGWNKVSQVLCSDADPDNDISPLSAQRVFLYETRQRSATDQPDYEIDAGFGGPVPFLSEKLGNLRFFTSYRRNREMLIFPLARPDYVNYDWTMQITSDISPSMKLRITGLMGKQFTVEDNWNPGFYLHEPENLAYVVGDRPQRLFSTGNYCLADIGHQSIAAKLTHTLSASTFYEISLEHVRRDYWSRPTETRDPTLIEVAPNYYLDAFPYGVDYSAPNGLVVWGGMHTSKARDNSVASSTTLKADITNQMNFHNLVKAGIELVYNDLDLDYGTIKSLTGGLDYSSRVQMKVNPIRAALYIQDKLEAKGFTMNAGIRLDYSNSNMEWWNPSPYEKGFFSAKYSEASEFETVKPKSQWQLSPRLGISHPITENSKLFFNYGHFKQMPQYQSLYQVARSFDNTLGLFGDPNLTLAKTISYELGYDHILFGDYLIQLAAFYNDVYNQADTTSYTSVGGIFYNKTTANQYEDIRGFELTLRKTSGQWWSGFANYTYQVSSLGHFGREKIYEDPSEQKRYDEATVNLYQERPIPSPFARVNLSFHTPENFGPSFFGHNILGGFMLNTLVDWQAGEWVTWNPKNIAAVQNNVEGADYFNTTLRFTKTFRMNKFRLQLLVDIENVLNTRRMCVVNWAPGGDRDNYMQSLHLPEDDAYDNIPGSDQFGDYRKPGVDFQPMEYQAFIDQEKALGLSNVIYYEGSTEDYMEYVDNAWVEVDQARVDKVLNDKAYIDMPNNTSFTFLNPRQIFFGLRLSFDLN
ncbi:TonB-dependent receptor domain-containing protein [bacterium]